MSRRRLNSLAVLAVLIALSAVLSLACDRGGSPVDECGDTVIGRSEECEAGDLDGHACADLGFDGGTLACGSTCDFDTSACVLCGDGASQVGEECDGADLTGETCETLGYTTGRLACSESCEFDTLDCLTIDPLLCGNDVLDAGEECEPPGTPECNARCLVLLDPWSAPSVVYDPACTSGCDETPVELGHLGPGFTLRIDPAIDDAVAQWGDCVESMLACLEAGSDAVTCVDASACPDACKDLFDTRAALVTDDEDDLLDVFEGVFIEEDAGCRPAEPVQP